MSVNETSWSARKYTPFRFHDLKVDNSWRRIARRFDNLLEKHYQELEVNYSISVHEDMETATFSCFNRRGVESYHGHDNNKRTKGNGAKALAEVCALADEIKIKLYLWTMYEELVPYYEKFGFAQTIHSGDGMWRFIRPYQ